MSSFLAPLKNIFDEEAGKYECILAEGETREDYLNLHRENIRAKLGSGGQVSDLTSKKDEIDAVSAFFACREIKTGEVVGGMRVTTGASLAKRTALFNRYGLAQFPSELLARVAVISHLVISRKKQGDAHIGVKLAEACYRWGLKRFALGVVACEPSFFPTYRALGFRPLGRVMQSPQGYRLPLYLVLHEYEHLKNSRSPFYSIAKEQGLPQVHEGRDWQLCFSLQDEDASGGVQLIDETQAESFHSVVTNGLSEKGKKQLLAQSARVDGKFGDVVVAKGDGGKTLGFVLHGALEVRQGDRVKAVLGEGDLFGEVGFVLGGPRTADVLVASESAEVVLLSVLSVERVSDPSDVARFWLNVARVIAKRLLSISTAPPLLPSQESKNKP